MSDRNVIESKAGPLEKVGHALLRRMGQTCPDGLSSLEDQRILTDDEQLQLKKIARFTVMRAALAGALSAVVAAVAALYAEKYFADDTVNYWLLFGGVSLLAAVVEVGFLYYDSLRAVHRISQACDVELFPEGEESSMMAGIMVRAAMELPNPPDKDPYINPLRDASKWRLMLGVIIYKGKIMVSNALAKVLVRKIFIRGAARAWLEFVAVPVTAGWNALVCFWVLREARVRAMGPSTVWQNLPEWLDDINPELAEVAQRAVGVCVSASRDLHPNHLLMLTWMRENSGLRVTDEPESVELFLQKLEDLNPEDKKRGVDVLAMATIIDGRASKHELKILSQVTGVEMKPVMKSMLHTFRSGQGIEGL